MHHQSTKTIRTRGRTTETQQALNTHLSLSAYHHSLQQTKKQIHSSSRSNHRSSISIITLKLFTLNYQLPSIIFKTQNQHQHRLMFTALLPNLCFFLLHDTRPKTKYLWFPATKVFKILYTGLW